MNIPADLAKLGFEKSETAAPRRLLVGTEGMDKSGKSRFYLTAPGPIAGINLDIGLEGVIEKWTKKKDIWMLNFNIPPVADTGAAVNRQVFAEHFMRTRAAYEKAVAHKDVRTIAIDSGSDWWELAKLGEFGTVAPAVNVKQAYTGINQLFRSMLRRVYETDKNLIITHKLKPNYVNDKWDGKDYKKMGFGEDQYLIQVNIRHNYDRVLNKFTMTVLNCRQDMGLCGMEWEGEDITFANLAVAIHTDTTAKDWV